jgi:P63C domain
MTTDILYVNENGIEFWTVEATGESAVSMRGLARMCGVTLKEVQRLLGLDDKTGNKRLETLDGVELYLTTKPKKNGKSISPISAEASSLIVEHCALDRGKEQARLTLRAFLRIGFDSYIQAKTGWLPKGKQSSRSSRSVVDAIIDGIPKAWYLHFDPDWQREACRVTGRVWHPSYQMGRFISKSIYQVLPNDVYQRLMQVNSDRRKRHHQFFTDDADELILKRHIQVVYGLLLLSKNEFDFWRHFKNAFGDGIQIDLDFEDAC